MFYNYSWDGTNCEFDSWQCQIYIISHVHRAYDCLGPFGVPTYGSIQILCLKENYSAFNIQCLTTILHLTSMLTFNTPVLTISQSSIPSQSIYIHIGAHFPIYSLHCPTHSHSICYQATFINILI